MLEVLSGQYKLGDVVKDLTRRRQPKNRIDGNSAIHLDPDLNRSKANRLSGWRPAFGQDGAAQEHLANQGVDIGDIFLFFGWFRQVHKINSQGQMCWDFVGGAPDVHVIFGWLQIGAILRVGKYPMPGLYHPWLKEHPHIQDANAFPSNNTIYIASDQLVIDRTSTGLLGGGTFREFSPTRQLTGPNAPGRTTWQLPDWFYPFVRPRRPPLTYHPNQASWERPIGAPGTVTLRSVDIGQEFVLNGGRYPEAGGWLKQLF
jgi:hypothetical protein